MIYSIDFNKSYELTVLWIWTPQNVYTVGTGT